MVFHAFKGDEEIDNILKEIPKQSKSKFIKEAIRSHVTTSNANAENSANVERMKPLKPLTPEIVLVKGRFRRIV